MIVKLAFVDPFASVVPDTVVGPPKAPVLVVMRVVTGAPATAGEVFVVPHTVEDTPGLVWAYDPTIVSVVSGGGGGVVAAGGGVVTVAGGVVAGGRGVVAAGGGVVAAAGGVVAGGAGVVAADGGVAIVPIGDADALGVGAGMTPGALSPLGADSNRAATTSAASAMSPKRIHSHHGSSHHGRPHLPIRYFLAAFGFGQSRIGPTCFQAID